MNYYMEGSIMAFLHDNGALTGEDLNLCQKNFNWLLTKQIDERN
jgi:hypothetical protein